MITLEDEIKIVESTQSNIEISDNSSLGNNEQLSMGAIRGTSDAKENRAHGEKNKPIFCVAFAPVSLFVYKIFPRAFFEGKVFLKILIIKDISPLAISASALSDTSLILLSSLLSLKQQDQIYLAEQFGRLEKNSTPEEQIKIGKIAQQSWLLAIGFSIPACSLLVALRPILTSFALEPHLIDAVMEINRYRLFTIPFDFMDSSDAALIESYLSSNNTELHRTSKCKAMIYRASIFASFLLRDGVDLFFTYALGHGKFGLPKLGLIGVGLAPLIASSVNWFFKKMIFLIIKDFRSVYSVYDPRLLCKSPKFEYLKLILKESVPTFAVAFLFNLSGFVANIFIGKFGQDRLKIYKVMSTWNAIFQVVPGTYFAASSGVFVAKAFGKKNFNEVRLFGNIPLLVTGGFALGQATLMSLVSRPLTAVFTEDWNDYSHYITENLPWIFLVFSLTASITALHDNLGLNLNSLHLPLNALISCLMTLAVTLPASAMISYLSRLDLMGIMSSQYGGYLIGVSFLLVRWLTISNSDERLENLTVSQTKSNLSSCCSPITALIGRWRQRGVAETREDESTEEILQPFTEITNNQLAVPGNF